MPDSASISQEKGPNVIAEIREHEVAVTEVPPSRVLQDSLPSEEGRTKRGSASPFLNTDFEHRDFGGQDEIPPRPRFLWAQQMPIQRDQQAFDGNNQCGQIPSRRPTAPVGSCHATTNIARMSTGINGRVTLFPEAEYGLERVSVCKRKGPNDSDGSDRSSVGSIETCSQLNTLDGDDSSASKRRRVRTTNSQDDQSNSLFVEDLLGKEWATCIEDLPFNESGVDEKDIVDALLRQWTVPVAT